MNGKQKHYYLYNGKNYENMKDCCQAIGHGISSKAFKHMIRMGIVEKIINNNDVQRNTKNSKDDKETTKTKF